MVFKKINKQTVSKVLCASMLFGSILIIPTSCEESSIGEDTSLNTTNPTGDFFTATIISDDFKTVQFRNYSQDGESYVWDFGDGNTSTEFEPTHTYEENGEYNVTLVVTYADGTVSTDRFISGDPQSLLVTAEEPEIIDDGGDETPTPTESNQFAFITDTSDADTGELRLDLGSSIPVGMMTVTVSKQITQDGFVNLSGSSTRRREAVIDMRINDSSGYSFTESGVTANATANFPAFVNDELVDMVITWDASNATSAVAPIVTVSIDGQDVTATAFPSESDDLSAIEGGVSVVQFRLGGGADLDATGAGFSVDDIKVYDTSLGAPSLVFEDDFESYNLGDSLDPNADTASNGPVADAIIAADSPYSSNSFQVTVAGADVVVEPEPEVNQVASITDTSDADTGELRLNLDASIPVGMMTVTVSKQITQDGFVNLSGSSTRRREAVIDMRINDSSGYSFTESGVTANATANFPAFVNDELVDMVITWDASNATSAVAPIVTVSIDGQDVTATAFPSESQDLSAIEGGVSVVQFRLGGGADSDATGANFTVDDIMVYDTSSGSPLLVFEDDFESYTAGNSLDPNADTADNGPIADAIIAADSPYSNNSFQVTVEVE